MLNDEQTDVMPRYNIFAFGLGGGDVAVNIYTKQNLLDDLRLALLRLETSSLFEIMSKTFSDTKSRLIFLINTYDLVLTLLAVSFRL